MARQWTGEQILDFVRAFQGSCVVAAACELDVFSKLSGRPQTAGALAKSLGTDMRGTQILLDALAALAFLKKQGRRYRAAPGVAQWLAEASPRNILPGVRHMANGIRRWGELARTVQTGRPARRRASIRGAAADTAAFIGAMHNFNPPAAVAATIARLGLMRLEHLLDVGGASGTWTIGFLRAARQARATIFDLPEVIPMARRRIAATELRGRVKFVAGDFYRHRLPKGADFCWLSAIAHQNSRRQNRRLFAKIYAALAPGGVLAIRDIVMDESRSSPAAGAMFAVNMLIATKGGGTYTFGEFRQDLMQAGFRNVEFVHRDPGMYSLIRARKPIARLRGPHK